MISPFGVQFQLICMTGIEPFPRFEKNNEHR